MSDNQTSYKLTYKVGTALVSKGIYAPTEASAIRHALNDMILIAYHNQGAEFISLETYWDRHHFKNEAHKPVTCSKVARHAGYESDLAFNNYLLSLYRPAI